MAATTGTLAEQVHLAAEVVRTRQVSTLVILDAAHAGSGAVGHVDEGDAESEGEAVGPLVVLGSASRRAGGCASAYGEVLAADNN